MTEAIQREKSNQAVFLGREPYLRKLTSPVDSYSV